MIPWTRFFILAALFLGVSAYGGVRQDSPAPLSRPLSQFPAHIGEWSMTDQVFFNPDTLAFLRPTDYLFRRYERQNGDRVDVYIGYHDGGQSSGPIHSPKNCLPGSGWLEVFSRPLGVDLAGRPARVTEALYGKGGDRQLFLYWFVVGDAILNNEFALKAMEVINAIRFGHRNAAFIRISLPASDDKPDAALLTAQDFLNQSATIIAEFLKS